jgi:tetratricopeptide (TPR) repeat protein
VKFKDFIAKVKKFEDALNDKKKTLRNNIQDFKDEHQIADEVITLGLNFLPSPFGSLVGAIYKGTEGSPEQKVDKVKEYFERIQQQGEDHYNNIVEAFEVFKREFYQNYGLTWLPFDYFKDKVVTENDLKEWKDGFDFKLPAIKYNLEYKREEVLNEIIEKLQNQNKLLILGESGLGKTTILMELLYLYLDKKDYLILYNWGKDEIKRGDKLAEFIGALLNEGFKILVIVDDVHMQKTTPIFYIMDQLSNHVKNKNAYFLFAARLPEFNSLQDSLDQSQQGRDPLRKFRKELHFIYRLNNFSRNEIEGFITKYIEKRRPITFKSFESDKPITKIIDSEESIRSLSTLVLNETNGHPIMIKFFLFRLGLKEDVENRYDDFLRDYPNRIKTMVVTSLLDLAHLQITDKLLEDMKLLEYARQLENATLYKTSDQTWKTIHAKWDEELLLLLYKKSSMGAYVNRIEPLEQAKKVIYQFKEIVYPVVGALYGIAALGIIPIDIIKSTFQIDSFEDKKKKRDLYVQNIGFAFFQLGKYEEALEYYDKALEIDSEYVSGYNLKGVVLDRLKRYNEALTCYNRALELDQNYIHAWHNKGLTLAKLDRKEQALESFDNALKIDNTYGFSWYSKGTVLEQLGRLPEALECFYNTERTGYWTILVGMNIERIESGLIPDKLKYYDRILEQDNNNLEALVDKGTTLYQLGRNDEALKCIERALEIDGNYVVALHNKGVILDTYLQNPDEALIYYDKVLEIKSDWALPWFNKGSIYFKKNDYNKALTYYNRALELDQNYFKAWYSKGEVLEKLGRDVDALECYNKALEIDNLNIAVWANKAKVLEKLGRDEDALECYNKILHLDPLNDYATEKKRLLLEK